MDKFGFEYLQPLPEFSCPVLNLFFDIRGFVKLVTDVDIHARLGFGRRSREAMQADFTPAAQAQNRNRRKNDSSERKFSHFDLGGGAPMILKNEQLPL